MESSVSGDSRPFTTPLQWGHDPVVMERHTSATAVCGGCILQWGHDPVVMERRAGSRGWPGPGPAFNGAMTLWSWRDTAPTPSPACASPFNGAMTLWSWRDPGHARDARHHQPFNGAMTLWSWREASSISSLSSVSSLQWGHDPVVMESGIHCLPIASWTYLQWGHDPVVMERFSAWRPTASPSASFNGAMTLWSWREQCPHPVRFERQPPSMGP